MKKIIVLIFFLLSFGSSYSQTLDTSVWTPTYDPQGFYKNMVWNKVEWYGCPAYTVKIPMNLVLQYETMTAAISNFSVLAALLDSTVVFVRNFSEITAALDSTITFVRNFNEITAALDSTITFVRNFSEVTAALDSTIVFVRNFSELAALIDSIYVIGEVGTRNVYDWSTFERSFRDTNASATLCDTLSRRCYWGGNVASTKDTFNLMAYFGLSKYYQFILTADDTIEISSDASFPANKQWVINGSESWTSRKIEIASTTNYYWRVLGTGTATVRVDVWGY